MKIEILRPVDLAHTELLTSCSTPGGIHAHTSNLPSARLVETSPLTSDNPSLVLLAPLTTAAQHATFHNTPTTSKSYSDSPMTVIEDTHTTHELSLCIDSSTTIIRYPPLSTPEHTAVPVEVSADV